MVDIRQLEYFVEIANHNGFNRAAAHLHIAQSALSRHIQQLEHELGVELFVRGRRGIQLTTAGTLLAQRAEFLLRSLRQTRAEIIAQSDLPHGELCIGLPPSLEHSLAAPLIRRFNAEYPGVSLTTRVGTSIEIREWIVSGRIDVGVFGVLDLEVILETRHLFRDRVYLVGPHSAGLKTAEPTDVSMLADYPLILTSRPNSMRLLIEQAAAKCKTRLNVLMEANSIPLTIELARIGAGFTALPYSGVHHLVQQGLLSATPLKTVAYHWVIGNSSERPLSAAGRRFEEMMLEMVANEGVPGMLPEPG